MMSFRRLVNIVLSGRRMNIWALRKRASFKMA
jgi:hypothetical protein